MVDQTKAGNSLKQQLRGGLLGSLNETVYVVLGLLILLLVIASAATAYSNGDIGSLGLTIMSGLFQGMLLFLVASGLSIVFGLMDVLNLAQGAYFTLGAYIAWTVHHSVLPDTMNPDVRFLIGLIAATAVGAVLGIGLEQFLLRPLYTRPIFQIVLTFGVGIVFGEIIKVFWGTAAYQWVEGFSLQASAFSLFEQQFSVYRLFVIVMGFVFIVSIALLLRNTRIGIIIRAGVEDDEMVEALGINVRFVFTGVFTLGCAVAALGGAVAAPFLGASLSVGQGFLLGAIAVVVLGGLGSYEGTAVGSVLVGLAIAVAQKVTTVVPIGTVWASMTPMLVLILVLLFRPSGLFGKER